MTEGKTATFWLTEQEFYLHKVEPEVDVPDTLVYVMNKDDFFFNLNCISNRAKEEILHNKQVYCGVFFSSSFCSLCHWGIETHFFLDVLFPNTSDRQKYTLLH